MPLFGKTKGQKAAQHARDAQKGRVLHSSLWSKCRPVVALVIKSVHRVFGDTIGVTKMADRAVKVVSDFTLEQKASLRDWVSQAEPHELLERQEAAREILRCVQEADIRLDLASKKLTSLPDIVGELTQVRILACGGNRFQYLPECLAHLRNLTAFTCDHNQLVELPEWISELSKLTYFNCSGNRLETLPEAFGHLKKLENCKLMENRFACFPRALLKLGEGEQVCKVFMENNPVPEQKTEEWGAIRGRGNLYVYCTPKMTMEEAGKHSLEKSIQHWFQLANRPVPDDLIEQFHNSEILKHHLYKLIGTRDYEIPEHCVMLSERVVEVLKEMAGDEDVMNACLAVSFDATGSCTDRAMLGLNDMEQAVRIAQASKSGSTQKLVELGAGFERLQMVKDVARETYFDMAKNPLMIPVPDETEMELAYMLGLKERLDLPMVVGQEMRYRIFSRITDKHIRKVEEKVKKRLDGRKCIDIKGLAEWSPLRDKLEDDYFGYVYDINATYQNRIERLDSGLEGYDGRLKMLLTEKEMKVDAFFQDAVQKMLKGSPLPAKTKAEAVTAMVDLTKRAD